MFSSKPSEDSIMRPKHTTFKAQLADFSCVSVLIMGFVGYIVKLIHIPVNNILVGGA